MKRRWLEDWPWETVVTINAALCKEKKALHKPTSDGYQRAQKLWETSRDRELSLRAIAASIRVQDSAFSCPVWGKSVWLRED
jgi:hypothetical protein